MLTSFRSPWVCLCVWVCGVSSSPVLPRTEAKVALENDMNVLMYGVLQFSDSLHHMNQNTEAKLARITHAITHTERLVQKLDQDTEETIRSERQIKDRLSIIQAETAALNIQAHQTKRLVYKVEQDDMALKQKLSSLEATLKRFTPDRKQALQATIQKHNTHLHDLMRWTEKQRQQLENQNRQVAELQKRINRSV
ncbi:Angiopoietin-like protein 8 [Bagarius yarrelli]|uniref:Angiopoietin-like protein 8 n=1 Tax=Bagarius yarrelli TaxID=175774 RepID=A0A556V898_BAGYA|nr:Angiopoietin-like protein 8 [Bagarius yarrelli]